MTLDTMDGLIQALKRLRVETGSLACLGCGHERDCGVHGCAIIRKAMERLSGMTRVDHPASTDKMVPLTLEQLREMDGEPVYMTFPSDTGNQCGHWALVGTQRWGAVSLIYGCGWSSYESAVETLGAKFYRRPPEGEEET